jgi:hypothetical protein
MIKDIGLIQEHHTAGTGCATMPDVERRIAGLDVKRGNLKAVLEELQARQEEILKELLPTIRQRTRALREAAAETVALIDANRHLFDKPKSRQLHGFKFGLRKGSGSVEFEDEDQVIKLIEKRFDEAQQELLIKTTKRVVKKALLGLDTRDLAALGCTVEDTGDIAFLRDSDTDVDKLVNALLKSADEE